MPGANRVGESSVMPTDKHFISTYSSGRLHLTGLDWNEVALSDISHALPMLCRYTGQCRRFYSIAEHSLLVAQMVPDRLKIHALLHDAHEAYIGDISRPVKVVIGEAIQKLEDALAAEVLKAFGLPTLREEDARLVRLADNTALLIEAKALFGENIVAEWNCGETIDPVPDLHVNGHTPGMGFVRSKFLDKFNKYMRVWKNGIAR